MDQIAGVGGELAADFIAHKTDQIAAAFLDSSRRAITNSGVLAIVPSLAINGTTQVIYIAQTCIRCSARPVVSSVNSRAAYCLAHWERLWVRGA